LKDNIINIFCRGNQELFFSAVMTWLLDPKGSHGLGNAFFHELIPHMKINQPDKFIHGYEVIREFRDGNSRFDILITPKNVDSKTHKAIVIENKTKSFGDHLQLDKYMSQGYDVVVLSLLPETLDSETKNIYTVIEYKTIVSILKSFALDNSNGYQFIINQLISYINNTLIIFELIKELGNGLLLPSQFLTKFIDITAYLDLRDNDIRTLNYFYYYCFSEYLKVNEKDLIFGELDYADAESQGKNTCWYYEKNMQGIPFMEAIIWQPLERTSPWRMHDVFLPLFNQEPFQIAPRIEVWLDPRYLSENENKAGEIMLGTWSDTLKKYFKEQEPYKSILQPKGSRNFHREFVGLPDLPFMKLANRLRSLIKNIFNK
jgi:hypothetical protein